MPADSILANLERMSNWCTSAARVTSGWRRMATLLVAGVAHHTPLLPPCPAPGVRLVVASKF
jgi:hypothetical protein